MSESDAVIQDDVVDIEDATIKAPPSYEERAEQKARGGGWVPEDEWVEAGNKAEDWVDARDFNIRGEFIGKMKKKDAELEGLHSQITNINQVHQAQVQVLRSDLEESRREAIKNDDKVAEQNINQQLNNLNVAHITTDSVLDQWNADNPWINENSPKSAFAKQIYGEQARLGKSSRQIIEEVEVQLNTHYPPVTQTTQIQESGSKAPRKKAARTLSMDDLTSEEKRLRQVNSAWEDEATFLKAVTDARNAENA